VYPPSGHRPDNRENRPRNGGCCPGGPGPAEAAPACRRHQEVARLGYPSVGHGARRSGGGRRPEDRQAGPEPVTSRRSVVDRCGRSPPVGRARREALTWFVRAANADADEDTDAAEGIDTVSAAPDETDIDLPGIVGTLGTVGATDTAGTTEPGVATDTADNDRRCDRRRRHRHRCHWPRHRRHHRRTWRCRYRHRPGRGRGDRGCRGR